MLESSSDSDDDDSDDDVAENIHRLNQARAFLQGVDAFADNAGRVAAAASSSSAAAAIAARAAEQGLLQDMELEDQSVEDLLAAHGLGRLVQQQHGESPVALRLPSSETCSRW